jgi:3-deoxy-D-manno-octulosonic-acid transferase
MLTLYNIFLIFFYKIISPFLSIFSREIKVWRSEQKKIKNFSTESNTDSKIWFHCSSAGEYEQVKQIINYFDKKKFKIIITFFSVNTYLQFKNKIKQPCSLFPLDTKKNINHFIEKFNIKRIFVAKNEIWPNLIYISNKKSIPIFQLGAKINESKINNILYGKIYANILKKINLIFVQDEGSKKILKKKNIYSLVSGDPRIDQVINYKKEKFKDLLIEKFIDNEKVFVAGSTDLNDLKILINSINNNNNNFKWIIVPHENSKKEIKEISKKLNANWCLYSKPKNLTKAKILIIDKVGILKYIYKYANIVYVGGGFSKGIHNCLEPAVFGKPLIFGRKYYNFPEAIYFIKSKVAFSIKDKTEFEKLLSNEKIDFERIRQNSNKFFKIHKGASEKITSVIEKYIN